MTGASAAAARTAAAQQRPDLQTRLRGLLDRSSTGAIPALAERLLPTPSSGRPRRMAPEEGFYWLRVSRWLADSFRLTASPEGRALLADLHWIQYCVYAVFRVQDDLLDGEAADTRLAVETNHLMVEASRCAARHFPGDSPFWEVFRETIDATSRAIVELDSLQRSPDRPPGRELELYRDQAACLKIAVAGVCIAAGREGDWRHRISPALDRLAVAAQIVDDLRDVSDDLAEGRINHVAWYLCRPVFPASAEAIEAVVAASLATTDRLGLLMDSVARRVDEALELLVPTLCARSHAFLREYRDGLTALDEQIARGRAKLIASERLEAA